MAQFLDYTGLGHFKDKNDALYAKQNGSYEGMTVGNAEQLVSSVGIEDQTPYNFRTSGGSVDIGDRMNLNAVVGGTVAWKHVVVNGNFETADGWGSGTVSNNVLTFVGGSSAGTFNTTKSREASVTANHVLFLSVDVKCSSANEVRARYPFVGNGKSFSADTWFTYAIMNKPTSVSQSVGVQFDGIPNANYYMRNFVMFDLTAMFGSTIADYVYTLESGTAGAGIAWLKKYGWFTKPYYPYAAANLQSVKTSAHKTIGFNQWDEEVESGYINPTNGNEAPDASKIRMKNYMPVLPNTVYYKKTGTNTDGQAQQFWNVYFDANKNYIGYGNPTAGVFTTPANCYFIRSGFEPSYGTTYKHDICINLSWDGERDGEYEPYEQHTYALDDVELRGVLKKDANNNLYYDGDRYLPDGTVERRYDVVDLGTLDWQKTSGKNNLFNTRLPLSTAAYGGSSDAVCNAVCAKYVAASTTNTYSREIDKTVSFTSSGYCYIEDSAYSDAATFKTSLSGVYLVYELATQTTESADAYTELQICDDFGTEEFVDAATRDFDMPVGHNTVYQPNLRAKLEMAPNSPDGDGDYLVRRTNGVNEYVLISEVKELPDYPTTDGTYVLKCTVADGTATLSWVSE